MVVRFASRKRYQIGLEDTAIGTCYGRTMRPGSIPAMTVSFDDWQKIELRTAEVVAAEAHPDADRLLVLKVRLGDEERQLVAGVRAHYEPEALVGRTIVVIANLEPATIRGVESQGMMLAVKDGDRVVHLTTDGAVSSGLRVT
jgi:methionyl-tRNA synthetase